MRIRFVVVAGVVLGCLAVAPASASAAFHLMKIREVHEGGNTGAADYVELQMHASGQGFVSAHHLVTYDNGGSPFQTYTFPTGVANGGDQRTILIASQGTVAATPDFVVPTPNLLIGQGGSACFVDTLPSNGIDCVSWGTTSAPTTSPSPVGNPALFATPGLAAGQSLERTIRPNCPTLLEDADDSDDSATDFALAAPSPRPNSVAPTETPCDANGGGGGPDLRLAGKKKRKPGRKVVVKASCADQDCFVEARGKVKLRGGGKASTAKKRKLRLRRDEADVAAGDTEKMKLRLSRSKLKKVKRTLRRGGRAKAVVKATAIGELGETDRKRKVRLKR